MGSAISACPFPPDPMHPGVPSRGAGDAEAHSHPPASTHPRGCQAPCQTPHPYPCPVPRLWMGDLVFPGRSMRPSIPCSSAGCSPTALLINCLLLLLQEHWAPGCRGCLRPALPAPCPACELTALAPHMATISPKTCSCIGHPLLLAAMSVTARCGDRDGDRNAAFVQGCNEISAWLPG